MRLWDILVLGTLRLNLNCDYDRVIELANEHNTLRQMLGHGLVDEEDKYRLQTLKDNVSLLTPSVLDDINQIVVQAGHGLLGKDTSALGGRCDSFVVETDVHYPTDINLLQDAIRSSRYLKNTRSGSQGRCGGRTGLTGVRVRRHDGVYLAPSGDGKAER